MHQSKTYYCNNLNIFSNGMSLLSLQSADIHKKAHTMKTQVGIIDQKANTMQSKCLTMKKSTSNIIYKLRKINQDL